MTTDPEEIEELVSAGLTPPEDLSDLKPEEIARIAEAKEANAKFAQRDERAFGAKVRTARNRDRDTSTLDPEEIRARMQEEEKKITASHEQRERRRQIDRDARHDRWVAKQPPAWRDADVDSLPTELRDMAYAWIADIVDNPKNLILTGPTGSGKTFCSYAIYHELYIDRFETKIAHIAAMLDEVREASNQNAALNQYKNANCLILDDFGSEKRSDWVNERLNLLFDHRWQWNMPTVVTTNLPVDYIFEGFGDRIASRLLSKAVIYEIKGEDRRLS